MITVSELKIWLLNLSLSFPCSLHETEIHKEDHQLEPIYRAETFLDRDYCMSQGTSYNYLDPNYFPANRWHGKQIYHLGLYYPLWKITMAPLLILCTFWKDSAFPEMSLTAWQLPGCTCQTTALSCHGSRSLSSSWTFLVCGRFHWETFLFTTLGIFRWWI